MNNNEVKNLMNDFMDLYAKRDRNIEFSDWLAGVFSQQLPNMSEADSKRMADEIINGVAQYDKTLSEINTASAEGISKEEWFADRLADEYKDMEPSEAGRALQLIERSMIVSNEQLIENSCDSLVIEDTESDSDWNKYSLKNKALEIGKQAALAGVAVAANALKAKMEDSSIGVRDALGAGLQDGIKTDPAEVKAAVAGAVKIAAEKGLADLLPEDASEDLVCGIAGVAVEGASALFDAANGEITMAGVLDRIGKAGVAFGCRMAKNVLRAEILEVPVVGPLLVGVLSGLFEHMESEKFTSNVYNVLHDTVVATWNGIKEFGNKAVNRLFNGEVALND